MSDISEKIRSLRVSLGMSQKEFSEGIGFSEAKIQNMENGKQRINHEFLQALLVKYNADLNKLLSPIEGVSVKEAVKYTDDDFVSIPRLSVEASAGPGALVDDESRSGSYAFNRKWLERRRLKPDNLSVIAVRGDSMEPRLTDGDLILVDRGQRQIADGLTYVIRVEDDLMVKMVQHTEPGMIILISANDYYPPREINLRASGNQTEIIGRVVASMQEW